MLPSKMEHSICFDDDPGYGETSSIMTCDALCNECLQKGWICNIGTCKDCGSATSSGGFILCTQCGRQKLQCQGCRKALQAKLPSQFALNDDLVCESCKNRLLIDSPSICRQCGEKVPSVSLEICWKCAKNDASCQICKRQL